MSDSGPEDLGGRVLVLAPTARDAGASRDLLADAGIRCFVCATIADVCREVGRGAGVALVTAEAVVGDTAGQLAGLLAAQPPWSDLPLIVLTPPGPDSPRLLRALEAVGPMTLMKRPVQVSTLVSAVRSALRDRRRQHARRDDMADRQRAADALRVEREQYRVTLSSIGDAVIATDVGARVTYLNPVAEKLTGWGTEEARGRPLAEVFRIVNETTRAEVPSPALRALDEGGIVGLANHTTLIARDGAEYPIDDSAAPIRGAGGEVTGAVLVFRDITEKKEAERALRERERQAAAILESISDGFFAVDRNWRFTYANARAEDILGRKRGDLLGSVLWDAYPGLAGSTLEALYHRVASTGTPESATAYYPDHDRWYAVHAYPAPDGISVYFGDVTIQQRAEERLRKSEERRRTALDAAELGAWSLDPATQALTTDARFRAIFGIAGERVEFERAVAAIHPDDRARVREAVEAATRPENPAPYAIEYRIVHPDGAVRWVSAKGRASPEPGGGRFASLDGTVADVTDRKRAEDALKEADRKKDDFIALLAHELRNPLAPIRNGLQVIRLSDDRAARERAQRIMDRQLAHMVRMIDDLLDVSRIGRYKMELRRARVALADVVSSAVETARPAIEEAGHELIISLPPRPVLLDADLTRLSQVLSNLLTNSAKYTGRGGKIWLSAGPRGGTVVVTVRDNGIGIPAAALPRIFDMFSQVDRSNERSSGGLGIGLALVKGLVEMHGGTVTVRSDGEGRGTEFTVTLPARTDGAGAPPVTPADDGNGGVGPKRRVLVVDDNRDGAESLADMLVLLGNEIETAHDGLEAIDAAERFRPEAILMDVGMPRLNGLDATRRIRERPWGAGVTIIALTGWGQDADRERTRAAGCDGHLVKPVNLSDLEKALGQLPGAKRGTAD